jgi:hypothetical protein
MANPTRTGTLVLQALSEGRQRAIAVKREAAAPVEREVRRALDVDILAGHPQRGRAARIARAIHHRVTERGVRKILERLFSGSDSLVSTRASSLTE